MRRLNRRNFFKTSLAVVAAPLILPPHLWGQNAPSNKLNVACVGIGPPGNRVSRGMAENGRTQIVALCDVDLKHDRSEAVRNRFPDARQFHDFREMFSEMGGEIDAVSIATPDHSHFPIAMHAMGMGKHVYVEKPIANTFLEADHLMRAAEKFGVVTQMGNQGHSGANYHQSKAWAEAGAFDDITKVVAYFNRGRRWHPWGDVDGYPEGENIPAGLHWDLWHTTAEERPFSRRLHPGNWRGWYRYGMGVLGDWGPHVIDTTHRFLELGLPTEVELVHVRRHNPYIFPHEATVRFHFPARGNKPPTEVFWYEGPENAPNEPFISGNVGRVLYGKDHSYVGGTHSSPIRVVPEEKRREVQSALPDFETGSDHYQNFVLSALGDETTRSPFSVAGTLNQVFNLGVIAMELGETNKTHRFDPETMKFTNNDEANKLLWYPRPRDGWEKYHQMV